MSDKPTLREIIDDRAEMARTGPVALRRAVDVEGRDTVTLIGGPFDGAEVPVSWGTPLVCQGTLVPEGMVARYRPTRRRSDATYRFRGFERVIATLPIPAPASRDSRLPEEGTDG